MKKNLIRRSTVLLALFLLQGCAGPAPATQPTTSPTTTPLTSAATTTPATTPATQPGTTSGEDRTVNYEILKAVPETMKSTVESLKKSRGYYYDRQEKVLVVFMGERSTGGYAIALSDIEDRDGTLMVKVREKSPKPGDIVTQAFTYPLLLIQLEKDFTSFVIRDEADKGYDDLADRLR